MLGKHSKQRLLHHLLLMKIVYVFCLHLQLLHEELPLNFLWHVVLIAVYFEIKWAWQLWQLLFIWLIRHCFHFQSFSDCHWYFLINEKSNHVSCVIMLLLLPSSLRWMLIHRVVIMAIPLCSLLNSEIY